jgi:hypothetical protein
MAGMSEYVVIQARKDAHRIQEAEALMVTVEGAANPSLYERRDIIQSIEHDNFWRVGRVKEKTYGEYGRDVLEVDQPIFVVVVDGEKFLRMDRDKVREDDLGDLPEISPEQTD